jgi:hypothetical protein
MLVSAPFSVGYARVTVRAGSHRRFAVTALVISVVETGALLFLLLRAMT